MANKQDLVEKVVLSTNFTKKDANEAVDAVFAAIQNSLQRMKRFN